MKHSVFSHAISIFVALAWVAEGSKATVASVTAAVAQAMVPVIATCTLTLSLAPAFSFAHFCEKNFLKKEFRQLSSIGN